MSEPISVEPEKLATHLFCRDFVAADLSEIKLYKKARGAKKRKLKSVAKYLEQNGRGGTVIDPTTGEILLCMNVTRFDDETGSLWLAFSTLAERYAETVPFATELFKMLSLRSGYKFLVTIIDPTRETMLKLAEGVGFEEEELMKGFGPNGADAVRYVWAR
jgi:hypothetical protein